MEPYRNLHEDSGVTHYEIGADFIRLQFRGGAIYRYDYSTPGAAHVERMKALAAAGTGLSSYVSRCVRDAYASVEK